VIVSIAIAGLLVGYLGLGIAGLCIGIMAGRLILSIGYPILIGRFLGIAFSSQLSGILRPVTVTISIFLLSTTLGIFFFDLTWSGATGWLIFIPLAGITGILMLSVSFYAGLSSTQRGNIVRRIRAVMATAESG
jgi:hypothetical protein